MLNYLTQELKYNYFMNLDLFKFKESKMQHFHFNFYQKVIKIWLIFEKPIANFIQFSYFVCSGFCALNMDSI